MLLAKDLRDLTDEDLKLKFKDLSKEIFELVNELRVSRKIEKPHLLREKKKEKARILTVLREKSIS